MKTKMSGRTRRAAQALGLEGALSVTVGGQTLGNRDRIDLLRAIAQQGSITQAAIAVGMSYKGAWDAVDAMNDLAGEPLVERMTGGRGGGSTRLTPRGARLVERFEQLDAVHRRFVALLTQESLDLQSDFALLRTLNMKTSARNQLMGTVTAIRAGAVNDEVELTLANGAKIVATVTRESTESLGLRINKPAFALVKASWVIVATELVDAKLSARNQLAGTVSSVTPGAVNCEVVIDIGHGMGIAGPPEDAQQRSAQHEGTPVSIAAIVTQASATRMGLAVGMPATALFKASSVILGVLV